MKAVIQIRDYIDRLPEGRVFATAELKTFGSRAAIDQTMSRQVKAGVLVRIRNGMFVKPKTNRFVGMVPPDSRQVAQAYAAAHGYILATDGATAALQFGLTTQVPTRPIFLTNGRSTTIPYGNQTITFRHASQKMMVLPDRPAGDAIRALHYLGKSSVTSKSILGVIQKLSPADVSDIKQAVTFMSGWLIDALHCAGGIL